MKLFASGLLIAAAIALGVTTAYGSAAAPAHHLLGKIPHHGISHRAAKATTSSGFNCGASCTLYEAAINKYFTDVAADSGTATNVYSIANQYCQGTATFPPTATCGGSGTPIAYDSTFGGAYVDGAPFPAAKCNDTVRIKGVAYADKYCLTDAQLQSEITKVIAVKKWPGNSTTMFFVFTPAKVGICQSPGTASNVNACSTNVFCAYHDATPSNVIYAVIPDDAMIPGGGCDSGAAPVGAGADASLSSISHEHNEAITDPYGDGWWAADGSENGDLCAYNFGTPLGTAPNGQPYNQTINGSPYWLQEEYSNSDSGCLQQAGGTVSAADPRNGSGPLLYRGGSVMTTNTVYAIYWVPVKPANTIPPSISGTANVGRKLTAANGRWSAGTKFTYRWLRCSSTGAACRPISKALGRSYTLTAADARHRLEVRVTGTNIAGSTVATSAPTATVKN